MVVLVLAAVAVAACYCTLPPRHYLLEHTRSLSALVDLGLVARIVLVVVEEILYLELY